LRHRRPKGPGTARPRLNHRATPRLYRWPRDGAVRTSIFTPARAWNYSVQRLSAPALAPPDLSELEQELSARGGTPETAAEVVEQHSADQIREWIEAFDNGDPGVSPCAGSGARTPGRSPARACRWVGPDRRARASGCRPRDPRPSQERCRFGAGLGTGSMHQVDILIGDEAPEELSPPLAEGLAQPAGKDGLGREDAPECNAPRGGPVLDHDRRRIRDPDDPAGRLAGDARIGPPGLEPIPGQELRLTPRPGLGPGAAPG
jgi:hypothetical protein